MALGEGKRLGSVVTEVAPRAFVKLTGMPRLSMWLRTRSWVPSSEPVSTITHELMYGATTSSTSATMCTSFYTIMFRQIVGRAVTGSEPAQIVLGASAAHHRITAPEQGQSLPMTLSPVLMTDLWNCYVQGAWATSKTLFLAHRVGVLEIKGPG
jgi:hypothetical protein